MKRSFKVRLGLVAVVTGVAALAALPASASVGAVELTGAGTISPGLVITGSQAQTFTVNASGVAATDTFQGSISCTWNGNDTIGSISQGSGSFTGTCTVGSTTESVSASYTRTGTAMVVNGSFSGGPITGGFGAGCKVVWTGFPPTHFNIHCWLWW